MTILNLIQLGGKALTKNSKNTTVNFSVFFFLDLLTLLLRAVIVYWGYNMLMPKFIKTLSNDPNNIKNFRELSYGETLILVISIRSVLIL